MKIYGLEVAQAEVMVSRLLAMNPGTATAPIDGIPTTEPAFNCRHCGFPRSARAEAEMAGYTVIDPTSVIATHLTEIIKTHAPDLLGRQETSALLDNVKTHYPVVVEELVPNLLTVGEIQRVLQNLLRERIPIRNLLLILETLCGRRRARAKTSISSPKESARRWPGTSAPSMPKTACFRSSPSIRGWKACSPKPCAAARMPTRCSIRIRSRAFTCRSPSKSQTPRVPGLHPIVLCSPSVRLALKRLTERAAPQLVVLSYSEIAPGLRVESIGQISTTDEVPETMEARV